MFADSPEVMKNEAKYIAQTFSRQPVVWDRGEGCRLWDKEGKAYLDFFSGHAVMNLGYGHARQLAAMRGQLERLVHTGNLYYLEPQVELARQLVAASFADRVFFVNSGAEVVELAIKVARKWARRQNPQEDRYEFLTFQGSFHGRTYGALSATAQEKYHQGLGPMLPGFKYVPFNNFVAAAASITNRTCAVLIEPVQGEGGVRAADLKYLQSLRTLCDQNHLLLIFDEIQCGLGRLGTRFAYESCGVVPDMVLLGKPLGGGLPLSALLTREDIADAMQPGDHGSTFGGNPVAAVGGSILLSELDRPEFLQQVRAVGDYFGDKLAAFAARFPGLIAEARGAGLLRGLLLKRQAPEAVRLALQRGLVINCTAGQVLRFLPPLVAGRPEVDEACAILEKIFLELNAESK